MAEDGEKTQLERHEGSIAAPRLRRSHSSEKEIKHDTQSVKVDKHGYPLVPQPSDNQDGPLVNQKSVFVL